MSQIPYGSQSETLGYESRTGTYTVAQFFNTVYAWMCVGLALSAVVGWYVAHSGVVNMVYGSRGAYTVVCRSTVGTGSSSAAGTASCSDARSVVESITRDAAARSSPATARCRR